MGSALLAAWLAGEAITTWRIVHTKQRPPAPGELLGITILFLAGAVVSDIYPKAAPLAVMVLWGLDVAALLNVLPEGLGANFAQIGKAEAQAVAGGPAMRGQIPPTKPA